MQKKKPHPKTTKQKKKTPKPAKNQNSQELGLHLFVQCALKLMSCRELIPSVLTC